MTESWVVYSNWTLLASVQVVAMRKTNNVRHGLLSVNITLHDTVLIDTNGRQQVKGVLVAGVDAVKDQADDDLLPGWATLVPELGLFQIDNVPDVLHDAVEGTRSKHLVFVVVGDGDKKFSVSVVHGRTQVVAIVESEIVGIASSGGVYTCQPENPSLHPSRTSHIAYA